NSITRQISGSTTISAASSTTVNITTKSSSGSSTTPISSSSTTPLASSGSSYGTIERNGTTITILNSSSTTPVNSSATPIERNGGYITIYPYHPENKTTYAILENDKTELPGSEELNSQDAYSYEESRKLLDTLREQYYNYISRVFDAMEASGVKITASTEIPIAEFNAPNVSVKLYAELSGSSTAETTPMELETSIKNFMDEEFNIDKLIDEFSVTFAVNEETQLTEGKERYMSFNYGGTNISINISDFAMKKIGIKIEREIELSDGLNISTGVEISIQSDEDFYNYFLETAAERKNEYYRDVAYKNIFDYNLLELFTLNRGIFEGKSIFADLFDIKVGESNINEKIKNKLEDNIKEKIEENKGE
ncbi:MAG: hypothetical protein ACI4EN_00115, partial [Butyrivibrio sp.]